MHVPLWAEGAIKLMAHGMLGTAQSDPHLLHEDMTHQEIQQRHLCLPRVGVDLLFIL